jgi:hypothetical protein
MPTSRAARETVPFGALFGAARGVQECLRELIAAETAPLSDGDLACALGTQGYRIADASPPRTRLSCRVSRSVTGASS